MLADSRTRTSDFAADPHERLGARLRRCDDGAIMVFGVFFAVLIVGMLYYFIGTAATIYYRERLQDAADASALASAIVHARGMNTLALINMIMAAILAILVALRLVEALILVAQAILLALAWLGGATASVAASLEVLRQQIVNIRESADPVVKNALKGLHIAGNVVKYVTPLGANAGVMTSVSNNYAPEVRIAVAIPARLTLPVEDDEYGYLCGKAGIMAVKLALLPLSPLLPSKVESAVAELAETSIRGGQSWFCGDGDAPSFPVELDPPKFPQNGDHEQCMSPKATRDDQTLEHCKAVEKFDWYSQLDPDGDCRIGQPVCDQVHDPDTGELIPFAEGTWCFEEGQYLTIQSDDCSLEQRPDGTMATPLGERLKLAREQCEPDGKKRAYKWRQRDSLVTWRRTRDGTWEEVEAVEVSTQFLDTEYEETLNPLNPCRVPVNRAAHAAGFNNEFWPVTQPWSVGPMEEPVCVVDEPKFGLEGNTVQKRRVEVLEIHGCLDPKPPKTTVPVQPMDVSESAMNDVGDSQIGGGAWQPLSQDSTTGGEFNGLTMDGSGLGGGECGTDSGDQGGGEQDQKGGGGGGDANMNPFRFEEDHKLGFSDMQIRAISLGYGLDSAEFVMEGDSRGETPHEFAMRVVEMTKWGADGELGTLRTLSEKLGMFAVAQAEYYFDVSSKQDAFAEWQDEEEATGDGEREYLWMMGWTARMRRFRLTHEVDGKSADGEGGGACGGSGGGIGGSGLNMMKGADSQALGLVDELPGLADLFLH